MITDKNIRNMKIILLFFMKKILKPQNFNLESNKQGSKDTNKIEL